MNAFQKATILVSFVTLPLVLILMDIMNYRGMGLAGAAWLIGTAGMLYALRTANASASQRTGRWEPGLLRPSHAKSSHRGLESRPLR